MHLVGFIKRIYHDARSPERQIFYFIQIYMGWWNIEHLYVSMEYSHDEVLCLASSLLVLSK